MERFLPLAVHSFSIYLLDIHDIPVFGTGDTAVNKVDQNPSLPGALSGRGGDRQHTPMNTEAEPLQTQPRSPSVLLGRQQACDWSAGSLEPTGVLRLSYAVEFPAASTAIRYLPRSLPSNASARSSLQIRDGKSWGPKNFGSEPAPVLVCEKVSASRSGQFLLVAMRQAARNKLPVKREQSSPFRRSASLP